MKRKREKEPNAHRSSFRPDGVGVFLELDMDMNGEQVAITTWLWLPPRLNFVKTPSSSLNPQNR